MKFTVDINLNDLFQDYSSEDCWGDYYYPPSSSNDTDNEKEFIRAMRGAVVDEIARMFYYDDIFTSNEDNLAKLTNSVNHKIDSLLKEKQEEIISAVVQTVSDKIAKKKQIITMTPKARDLAKLDKDNEEYFLEMVDKAIAKRFKGMK